jgi:uncharacterized protein
MERREFLITLAGLAGAGALSRLSAAETAAEKSSDASGAILPKRALGRTGEAVTMLGLGGYHVGWTTEARAQATIEAALMEGIRFFDTAESYAAGVSEQRYGTYLVPKFRNNVFLMTKTTAKDAVTARAHLDGSRRRLKTDVIDLWQLHALESPEDVDARIAAGVVEVLLEAKCSGVVRHLGFTGHASPYALAKIMEHYGKDMPFATCQMPVNPVDTAAAHSFAKSALPKAVQHGLGVLAMKTLADGRFFAEKTVNGQVTWQTGNPIVPARLSLEECLLFVWSLPTAVLITGAEKPEYVRDKAAICRKFHTLNDADRLALVRRVATFAEAGQVEYYKEAVLGT